MFSCSFCERQLQAMIACPECGKIYCSQCYPSHRIFDTKETVMNPEQREFVHGRLRDTEGTPTPAATTPKIYRGGGGSPDEPPEAAGAPNRPRVEARRQDKNPP